MRDRIKQLRKSLGMTQAEFGVSLGFAATSAASWEKVGAQEPSSLAKQMMQKTHNVNIHWLETGEGDMFLPKAEDDQALVSQLVEAYNGSTVLRALLTTYMQLDAPRRAIFEDFIERFSAALAEAKAAGTPPPDASAYIRERTAPAPDQQAQ